jgi:hypothetical protein
MLPKNWGRWPCAGYVCEEMMRGSTALPRAGIKEFTTTTTVESVVCI